MKKILIAVVSIGVLVAWYVKKQKRKGASVGTNDFPDRNLFNYRTDELHRDKMYAGS